MKETVDGWAPAGGWFVDRALAAAGVIHGVSTRALGDMKEPSRQEAALKGLGLDPVAAVLPRQVHGDAVALVERPGQGRGKAADALVTRLKGAVLAVVVADCLPVYAFDPAAGWLGLAHVGWRGARAGTARRLAETLSAAGASDPRGWVCAVGPHVGPCCYAVGPETAALFPRATLRRGDQAFVDLAAEVLLQLEEAGVPPQRVSVSRSCTACSPKEFFSFRRDKTDARMVAVASLPC